MENTSNNIPRLHQDQPVFTAGERLDRARAAVVMLHGRGASAQDILSLSTELIPPGVDQPGVAFLAPQAAGNTWYPYRFLEPVTSNEPWLSSALDTIRQVLGRISEAGISMEKTILLGFSQGGCLALEYAARNARRYGGVVGLSAGVIGADGEPRQDRGNLAGTPVFLGCSEVDFHISRSRVEQSVRILQNLGGMVTVHFYPNLGHAINQDEVNFVRSMLLAVLSNGKLDTPVE